MEYIIHETELKDTKKQLDELENMRKSSGDKQKEFNKEIQDAQDKLKALHRSFKEARRNVELFRDEKSVLNTEQQQLLREKAKLDLAIGDLTEEVQGDNKTKDRAEQELEQLKITIAEKEKELDEVRPQFEAMKQKEEEFSQRLAMKEQKRKELYAKQGRGSQFKSREDRDKWIQSELKSLSKQIKDKITHQNKMMEDSSRDTQRQSELEKKIEEHTAELESMRAQIDEFNKESYELKKKKDELQAARQ